MGLKDRLMAKSGDIGVTRNLDDRQGRERPATPKTGPGQMAAFRVEMLEHRKEVDSLKSELEKWDGALPVRKLDPKSIHPSRWANRHEDSYEDAEFLELEEAMRLTQGNVQPIKVRTRADGEYERVFGSRRHRACLKNGWPVLAMIDDDLSDRDVFLQMEHENRERRNPSAWEQGRSYQLALDAGLWPSQNAMATDIGISQGHVSRSISAFALPDAIVSAFKSPNDIQFPWIKDLADLSKLDSKVLAERVGRAAELTNASPKQIFAALTGEVTQTEAGKAAGGSTERVSVTVSGKTTKVVCKTNSLSPVQQQELADLVDRFIQERISDAGK